MLFYSALFLIASGFIILAFTLASQRRIEKKRAKFFLHGIEKPNLISKKMHYFMSAPSKTLKYYALWLFLVIPIALMIIFLLFFTWITSAAILIFYTIFALFLFLSLYLKREKRNKAFMKQFPQALDAIIHDLQAGRPILLAFRNVSLHFTGIVAKLFNQIYHETELGTSLPRALQTIEHDLSIPAFSQFAMIVTIHHQTGSDPSQALVSLINIIRQKALIQKKITALATDGRISAIVFSILPPALFALMWSFGPTLPNGEKMIMLLFTTHTGKLTLLYSVLSYLLACVLVFKIARIRV